MMLPLIITLMSRSILFEDTSTWQGCMTSINLCTLIIVGGPDVSGTLPPEMSNMVLLTSLIIIDAPLSGTIPANLGGLTDMQVFTLSNTSISGTLNAELGTLPGLLALKITNSPVSGTIPPSVNNLPSLSYLQFYANKMSGTLPVLDNIGKVGSVEKGFILTVGNNDVSGTIHASMFKTMVKATSIMLYNSQMSGSLPDSLYALSDLLNLQLGGNKLTGTIPVSWEASRQSPLTHLDFHNNLISGTIPDSIAAFTALNFVWLGDNPITGLIPSSIGQLTDLVDFDVTGTQLVGASSGICELTTAMGHCLLSPNPMWVNGSLCPHCLTATSACYRATYHTEAPVICTGA